MLLLETSSSIRLQFKLIPKLITSFHMKKAGCELALAGTFICTYNLLAGNPEFVGYI